MLLVVMVIAVIAVIEEVVVFWTAVNCCGNPFIWWSLMASKSLGCQASMSGCIGGVLKWVSSNVLTGVLGNTIDLASSQLMIG